MQGETHPKTGAAQLVEIRETVQEIRVPTYVTATNAPGSRDRKTGLFGSSKRVSMGLFSRPLNRVWPSLKKNIALGATIGEVYRKDRWEYPLEAIREAIINAVIHRDYAILGSDIKVAIYDDMLEITSPAPLPDLLSFEDLGTGRSEIRNRVLAPIFKDMKLIEAWGSGIQKIKTELNDYPEIDLVLQEPGHAFQVQFVKKERDGAESGQSRGRVRAESGQSRSQSRSQSHSQSRSQSHKERYWVIKY